MIYLDHHAATPLGSAVRRAMAEAEVDGWANPSSVHGPGRRSRQRLEGARAQVAAALGASPSELVFTSGGTEACELAIAGLGQPTGVVTWRMAHPAVLGPCERWAAAGVPLTVLDGLDMPGEALLHPGVLVAVPWVGHETGNVLPLRSLAERAEARGARVVVDANQALGRLSFTVDDFPVHAMAIAAHKVGGPSGAGALWVRRGCELHPRVTAGGQERGRRGGSPSVVALAGFGAACEALPARVAGMTHVGRWRDRLETAGQALGGVVNGSVVGGARAERVASVTNLAFAGWKSEHLVAALDLEGLAASAGAACSSGLSAPSPGVATLHPDEPWRARSALRLSLGPEGLSDEAVDQAVAILQRVVPRARPI